MGEGKGQVLLHGLPHSSPQMNFGLLTALQTRSLGEVSDPRSRMPGSWSLQWGYPKWKRNRFCHHSLKEDWKETGCYFPRKSCSFSKRMDKTLDLDHKPVSGFSDGNEILRDKLPHVRATAQSEEKTDWELMHRLNSGFRLFLWRSSSLCLLQGSITEMAWGSWILMTCWNHTDLGLNPDCDSQARHRSALSPLSVGTFREMQRGRLCLQA